MSWLISLCSNKLHVGNVIMFVGLRNNVMFEQSMGMFIQGSTGKERNTFRAKSKISFTYPLGIVVNNQLCDTRFSIGVNVFISILLLPIDGSEGVEVDYVGIHVLIVLSSSTMLLRTLKSELWLSKGDVILFAHGAFFLHCLSVWPWLNISMNCSSYHGSKRGLSIVFPLIGLGLTREKDCVLMFCIAFLFCFLSCRCLCWDIQNDEVAKLKKNQNSWLSMPTAIQGRLR